MPIPGQRRSMGIALPGARAAHVGFMRGTPTPTQTETTTLLAAMSVQPSAGRTALINDTIFALKNAGVWTTLDFLYVLAAHDAQAGRVNWVTPASVATATASPVFTADRGYASDAVGAWIDTGLNWSTLAKFKQDTAAIGIWVQAFATAASALMGGVTASRVVINPRNASGNLSSVLNNAGFTQVAVAAVKGHSAVSRNNAANYEQFKDGVSLGLAVTASIAVTSDTVALLRNTSSFSLASLILGAAHGGSQLSAAQVASLNSILSTYMAGVGAP